HPNYGPVRLNSISYRTSNASHPRISFTLLPPLSPFPPASASSPPAAAGPGPESMLLSAAQRLWGRVMRLF
ncbi:hypothetical protein NQZ68_008889, partial [Dissostichus eleginoides]